MTRFASPHTKLPVSRAPLPANTGFPAPSALAAKGGSLAPVMAAFSLKDAGLVVDEASLTAAFDCEESAGELPTRALSDALILQVSGETLTLCDLEVLDGKTPGPVDVIGRLTRIDKVMDPVADAELGPNVRLRGVTEWSVEYDALTATVWVSTATADYKLVRPAPAYAKLWEDLELKTLLSARAIALITETKGTTFGQLTLTLTAHHLPFALTLTLTLNLTLTLTLTLTRHDLWPAAAERDRAQQRRGARRARV